MGHISLTLYTRTYLDPAYILYIHLYSWRESGQQPYEVYNHGATSRGGGGGGKPRSLYSALPRGAARDAALALRRIPHAGKSISLIQSRESLLYAAQQTNALNARGRGFG